MKRDAHTQAMIDEARAVHDYAVSVGSPCQGECMPAAGPFDDKPDDPPTIGVALTGEEAAAYLAFQSAAREIAHHQRLGQGIEQNYRAALQRLSVAASGVK